MIEFTATTAIGGNINVVNRVEYIQSSGTQYIDTGIIADQTTVVDIKFKMVDTTSSYAIIFGSRTAWGSNAFLLFRDSANSGKTVFNFGNNNSTTGQMSNVILYNTNVHTVKLARSWSIDNYSYTLPTYTFTTPQTCLLFGGRFKPTDGLVLKAMCIYYCKITKNGVLVRDLVPVKHMNNGVAEGAMYDYVSGQMLTNKGSGTFTCGSSLS